MINRKVWRTCLAQFIVVVGGFGCAAPNQFIRVGNRAPQEWTMNLCPGSHVGVGGHLVRSANGGWLYKSGEAPMGTPGAENIRVIAKQRTVCLSAPYPKVGSCPVGLFGNIVKQEDDDTSLCASAFTKRAADGLTVIALPLSVFLLSVLLFPAPDESFGAAVAASDAIYLSYQEEYRHAGADAEALKEFVLNHEVYDPDNWVPLARQRIQAAEEVAEAVQEQLRIAQADNFDESLTRMDAETDPALASVPTARESVEFLREMVAAEFAADTPCIMTNRRHGGASSEPLYLSGIRLDGQSTIRTTRLYGFEGSDKGLIYELQVGEADYVRVAQSPDVPIDGTDAFPMKSMTLDDAERVSRAVHALALRCGARIDGRFR